jgi:hypothetical protein
MNRRLLIGHAFLAMCLTLPGTALPGVDDYRFEPVKAEIKASNVATLMVRLIHKPSGTPVAGAEVTETRLIMHHHGAADMVSAIAPLPNPEPTVLAFTAPMMMEGSWSLIISAKVPGESGIVTGTLAFRVNR